MAGFHARLLCPWGSPGRVLEWGAFPGGLPDPGTKAKVFCTAGGRFTARATGTPISELFVSSNGLFVYKVPPNFPSLL